MFLLKMSWFRRSRSDTGKSPSPTQPTIENTHQAIGIEENASVPDLNFSNASFNEKELIVNQLAVLTATTSHTSISTTQSNTDYQEEEETFYHLRSWITTSHLPLPSHISTTSTSTLASNCGRRESQVFDRKRDSSILNLNIGDLPILPFTRPEKDKVKSGPRYSPLPPPYVPKPLAMRPEVRF